MKNSSDFMTEANAIVPRISAEEAIAKHAASEAIFVDVRDSSAIAKSGTIAGALTIPRGMIEFVADPETQFHNAALQKDADINLICGAGGQAALAGKTLKDMGFTNITNVGGFGDWKAAGGPVAE
ncbi:rhodanese-like domain-containing protein [Yoonia sediminilitoris]|uniref:Rhodanese-related sulfurtransferase n=1 Tax=Yoonia sediminilitoris TaxID=1286148 RepID=A0A2T6KPQ8_9RHOB|nr:rhodanese-like domain-containing protein [Yoonia sediminilitoris]PUB18553.1 rhodanese-related sulfurtransferase [Yoonia sediminilitoris]RCW98721.1 rhodanese-related sulfurtransferase [Yoonia sediminilitoris]